MHTLHQRGSSEEFATIMSRKKAAAFVCMLGTGVPCSGFVNPGQLGGISGGAVKVEQPNACGRSRHGRHVLRPYHSGPRGNRAFTGGMCAPRGTGIGRGEGGARSGLVLAAWSPRASKRLLGGLMMGSTGDTAGGGGCEMEGEVGEGASGGSESLPSSMRTGAAGGGEGVGEDAQQVGGNSGGGTWSGAQSAADGSVASDDPDSLVGGAGGARAEPSAPAAGEGGAGEGLGESHPGEGAGITPGVFSPVVTGNGGGPRGGERLELPLSEREGFSVVEAVLPKGSEELVMDMEILRDMRSRTNRLKRDLRKAVAKEDYGEASALKKEVAALRAKDPLYVVSDLLRAAVSKEKFKKAAKLRDAKDWIVQESRGSLFDTDRLLCLGNKATNVITTDPEGSDIHRFLDNREVKEITKTGQIQLPVWSPDGRMVAFSVLKAGKGRGNPIESARILVFREGGSKELDVNVPRPPFLLMWAPNSQSLTYLSNTEGPDGPTIRLSEVLVSAARTPSKTQSRGLAQGNPLFFAFTKKNPRNAIMVVHTGSRVYSLDLTSGAEVEISKSPTPLFMAPSTHCVGGEDAVLVVEGDQSGGQHLVSVKADGSAKKRLCPTRGFSTFAVSPDGRRVCLMQQDLTTGFYTISVLEGGHDGLDPLSTSTMEKVEIPLDRVIMAFFFSPDSKKILCLATKMSKSELSVARSSMRLGFQLKFQWVVFHCESRTVSMLDEFSPRQFFLKMYLPYFDMFAQGFTPWSPDGKSFAYVAADAAFVQEIPDEGQPPKPVELGPNMEFVSWSFC